MYQNHLLSMWTMNLFEGNDRISTLIVAKSLNGLILLTLATISMIFLSPLPYSGLYYVVNGFLVTECTVVGCSLLFDYLATVESFQKYKIRKDHKSSNKLIERSIWERLASYRTEWMLYTLTWALSTMTFVDNPYPGIARSTLEVMALCFFVDGYIFFAHLWMHSRQGYFVHKKHHSFQFVNCWFVDHESGMEAVLIAMGKHGALAYYSPHPQTALEYLFVNKLWNVMAHCGYNLPLFDFVEKYVPFMGTPNRHEQHHYHGDANLAIFTNIWDFLGGSLVWTDEDAIRWRREKHHKQREGKGRIVWQLDPIATKNGKIDNSSPKQ